MPRQARGTRPALSLRSHGLCIGSYGGKIQTHCVYIEGALNGWFYSSYALGPFLDIAVHAQLQKPS